MNRYALLPAVCLFTLRMVAAATPPEISYIHPEFHSDGPRLIMGEAFGQQGTEVWCWDPPTKPEDIDQGLREATGDGLSLPDRPPADSRRVELVDSEPQVLVARLTGTAVWVKTASGTAAPYPINLPSPRWLSQQRIAAGQAMYAFGFGLRVPYQAPRVALKAEGRIVPLEVVTPMRDSRIEDPHLVWFEIPHATPPGQYTVWFHNGMGGKFGWRSGAHLDVTPASEAAPAPARPIFDVRHFGARGDDETDDTEAIVKTIDAAKAVGGIVYFPPGKWRTDTTVTVPEGVSLRGSSRDVSILEGFGDPPKPGARHAALIHARSHTSFERLTFSGAVYKGPGYYWEAVITAPPANRPAMLEDITVRDCRAYGSVTWPSKLKADYRLTVAFPQSRRIRVLDCEIFGSLSLGSSEDPVEHAEIIGNTIHGRASAADVLAGGTITNSLVDANRFVDSPGRVMFLPWRNCSIRMNEIEAAHRGSWTNAEEFYLAHGGANDAAEWCPKTAGTATAATAATLSDSTRKWKPGLLRYATVLITAGRGLGQYRGVAGNTADTLTVDRPWRVVPDASSEYVVTRFFADNSFYGNLNLTPGRLSLWLDCIGNVVELHRDAFGRGVDVWGSDTSAKSYPYRQPGRPNYYPSFYNTFKECWLDGSSVWLYADVRSDDEHRGPALFGNRVERCFIRQPHQARTGFAAVAHAEGGILIGTRPKAGLDRPQTARAGVSHSIVVGNSLTHTPLGITVSEFSRKTFVLNNEFEAVTTPLLDWGMKTVFRGNRTWSLDQSGVHNEPIPDR